MPQHDIVASVTIHRRYLVDRNRLFANTTPAYFVPIPNKMMRSTTHLNYIAFACRRTNWARAKEAENPVNDDDGDGKNAKEKRNEFPFGQEARWTLLGNVLEYQRHFIRVSDQKSVNQQSETSEKKKRDEIWK